MSVMSDRCCCRKERGCSLVAEFFKSFGPCRKPSKVLTTSATSFRSQWVVRSDVGFAVNAAWRHRIRQIGDRTMHPRTRRVVRESQSIFRNTNRLRTHIHSSYTRGKFVAEFHRFRSGDRSVNACTSYGPTSTTSDLRRRRLHVRAKDTTGYSRSHGG